MMENLPRPALDLRSPWMNASGVLGFAPPAQWNWGEPMGAFVTNPISISARTPAETRSVIHYPGGFLMHSGLVNPGMRWLLGKIQRWAKSRIPIWVHIIGSSADEIHRMVLALEGQENVAAIELGIPPEASPEIALDYVAAAVGELPVIVNIGLEAVNESWICQLPESGVSAISLGAIRGTLPGQDGNLVTGSLYGPSVLPLTLAAVRSLKKQDLPIIAAGGVFKKADGESLLAAGALAVQLDAVLWF
jgi:dihydroorotate dehydrogenase